MAENSPLSDSQPVDGRNPATAPNASTGPDAVLYDGQCPVCRATADRLAAWDCRQRLELIDLDSPEVLQRWPELNREDLEAELHVIEPTGHIHRGADAVRRLSRLVPWLWPLMPVLYLPGTLPLWRKLYHIISKRRYRLISRERCEEEVCQRHRPH